MKRHDIVDVLKQLDRIPLPNKEKILSACPQPPASNSVLTSAYRRKPRLKPMVAACAALILLFSGFTTYALAAEVRVYNEAVTFFYEYDLSTDGLSRGEIKKVYRDITTGSFTYSKTAVVIENSISKSVVGGYEIFQDSPTPEDLESLWNYKNNNGRYWIQNSANDGNNGVSYKYYSEEKHDENLGSDVHEKSIFEKYTDNKLDWSAEFSEFWIENYVVSEGKIIVYGRSVRNSSLQTQYAWMAMIDHDGTVLWETKLENGFRSEYIGAIIPTEEKIVVFSRGDLKYLCLSEYNLNGIASSFHKTEVGNYGIWNAAKLGEGYIVQLGNYTSDERIVKISSDGTITDSFVYDSDDSYYYVTDMIEYNGCVYLSAYSVPVLENEENNAGGRYDIAAVLNYIFDNQMLNISNEELTGLVRDNFTALLLVCDPVSGTPQEFYSIKGSLGGKLTISNSEKLLWDVESITDTFFSPATSSFTIGGACHVYRYAFDENGNILSQEKTGEIVNFRR